MGDYISRDMVIARLTKVEVTNRLATMTDAKREIAEMPAADVAPVVRCKDCEYSWEDIGGLTCSYGRCADCIVPEDFFCADGAIYDTFEDSDSVPALEPLVRNVEAVMNFEEDKHATDRC